MLLLLLILLPLRADGNAWAASNGKRDLWPASLASLVALRSHQRHPGELLLCLLTSPPQAFSSWVLYGEPLRNASTAPAGVTPTAAAASATCAAADLQAALGAGSAGAGAAATVGGAAAAAAGGAAPAAISPVFTLWLTLLMMIAANCLGDYLGSAAVRAAQHAAAQELSGGQAVGWAGRQAAAGAAGRVGQGWRAEGAEWATG